MNGIFKKSSDYSKLEDEDFINSVHTFDIIGLVETRAGPYDIISLEGFHTYQVNISKTRSFSCSLWSICPLAKIEQIIIRL